MNQDATSPIALAGSQSTAALSGFLSQVYGWMCFGLALSAGVSVWVARTPDVAKVIWSNELLFIGLIIVELVLVVILAGLARRLTAAEAALLFLAYAALNGFTLSVIFAVYTVSSILSTFAVAAGTFGAMSLYGYFTKKDLTTIGNLCLMALFGLIIAMVVNIFIYNNVLNLVISVIGLLIFVGLTAYDTQKLKAFSAGSVLNRNAEEVAAINGALQLYLDFINIFLMLLRLFGRRR